MNNLNKAILPRLLSRGDDIAVVKGCLMITPASGKQVPDKWQTDHDRLLEIEIVNLLNIDVYSYTDYSTGRYGKNLYQGVTLQFENTQDDSEAYAILNVEITRARTSKHGKAGDDLPSGQFRVGPKHNFYKFWRATGIKLPKRNSAFHDYMGKLKKILFVGELGYKNKFSNKTLKPLELSSELILAAFIQTLPDNIQTTSKQIPDNYQTRMPNKEMTLNRASNEVALNLTTGESKYGLSYQGSAVISNPLPNTNHIKKPHEQTTDEWLSEWEQA